MPNNKRNTKANNKGQAPRKQQPVRGKSTAAVSSKLPMLARNTPLMFKSINSAASVSANAYMVVRTRISFDQAVDGKWYGVLPTFNFEAVPLRARLVAVAPPAAILATSPNLSTFRLKVYSCVPVVQPQFCVMDGKAVFSLPETANVVNCASVILPWKGARHVVGSYNYQRIYSEGNLSPNGELLRFKVHYDCSSPSADTAVPDISFECYVDWACNFPTPGLSALIECLYDTPDSIKGAETVIQPHFKTDSKVIRTRGGWFSDEFSSLNPKRSEEDSGAKNVDDVVNISTGEGSTSVKQGETRRQLAAKIVG